MKKMSVTAISFLLVLMLAGCTNQKVSHTQDGDDTIIAPSVSISAFKGPSVTDTAALVSSYYAGQDSRAFGMLQKNIFRNWVENWSKDAANPKWDFDTFTRYYVLDKETMSAIGNGELYLCTVSGDNDRYGYIVVEYHGDSLSRVSTADTLYPYDLKANLADISVLLDGTDIDMATAEAARVSIVDAESDRSKEAIRITDGRGHDFVYYLE